VRCCQCQYLTKTRFPAHHQNVSRPCLSRMITIPGTSDHHHLEFMITSLERLITIPGMRTLGQPSGLVGTFPRAESGVDWDCLAVAPAGDRNTALLAGETPLRHGFHPHLGHCRLDVCVLFEATLTGVAIAAQPFADEWLATAACTRCGSLRRKAAGYSVADLCRRAAGWRRSGCGIGLSKTVRGPGHRLGRT
jgi:hypothetical protein